MLLLADYPSVLDEEGVKAVVEFSLRVLEEVGFVIENRRMCERLAAEGLRWDGEFGVKFPADKMSAFMDRYAVDAPGGETEGGSSDESTEKGREVSFFGSVGGYPLRWVDPGDGAVKDQTAVSMADIIRLADFLPNIDAIGSVGVPLDIPPLLQPFYVRYLDWRYAEKTLANTYIIWDTRLCPHIVEFCRTVSEMEPEKGGMERFFRANNYLVSPLKYAREEAGQFMWFQEQGYRCTIGNLISMGGTSPATVAGAVGMGVAEMLAISFIHHVFYGDEGFSATTKIAPLDMRTGFMPYGRPEQALAAVAFNQVAEYLGAGDRTSVGTATGAKGTDFECGLNKGLAAGLDLAFNGKVAWSFGKYSTDEVIDPGMMVIEDEFIEALKRFAGGIEVSEETLPLEVVREVGPGGEFLSHPHTMGSFRKEMWLPKFFSGESIEAWTAAGSPNVLGKARRRVLEVLESYHPRGIREETEEALLGLIGKFADALGVSGYVPPQLPD